MKKSRSIGFIVIALTYIAATGLGVAVYWWLADAPVFARVLAGDVAATILVFAVGMAVANVSVYDPYWSVAPIIICILLAFELRRFDAGTLLLLFAICYWGVRLTANWAYTFTNLNVQDWRYDDFKRAYPKVFPLIAFFGITLFPTVIVYLCLLPAIAFISASTLNLLTLAGGLICFGATSIQLVADVQMQRFRRLHRVSSSVPACGSIPAIRTI